MSVPNDGPDGERKLGEYYSLLGKPITLRFRPSKPQDTFVFAPAEGFIRESLSENLRIGGRDYDFGIWSVANTNLGTLVVLSINDKIYKVLISSRQSEASSITAIDWHGSITIFSGNRAIAQAVGRRGGEVIFGNAQGSQVAINGDVAQRPTPELVRMFPPDVLTLFDANLQSGLKALSNLSEGNGDVPTLPIWPLLVLLCCVKVEVSYSQGEGFGGSVGWDCGCL